MRPLYSLASALIGGFVVSTADVAVAPVTTPAKFVLGWAFAALGYALGNLVKAQQDQAEALDRIATTAAIPYALATGAIDLADLVDARVPDAPPEDMR